ncbi:MAG: Dam family site-specific DNA-(adenine-N6)-methyltransferase [Bernardetiaceae bacterium]
MQLQFGLDQTIYTPPRTQLLKWIGNKQKFASQITRYFPNSFNRFFEPFIGSGAITATVSHREGVGSDVFKPLIEIWQKLKSDPHGLIEWYAERRNLIETEDKIEVYQRIKRSYNENPNGADFLFLSRSCYGGVIRFRKQDGYMSTPCGAHQPIRVQAFAKRVNEWKDRMKGMDFVHMDYQEAFDMAQNGDLIYCDPPYSHSQSILYGAQDFSLVTLFEKIKEAKDRGVYVALSIDGQKKSGHYVCDVPIPEGVFNREVFIDCGKSMLNRFQNGGGQMVKEQVHDRLLLTY